MAHIYYHPAPKLPTSIVGSIVFLFLVIYVLVACKVTGTLWGPLLWGIAVLRWIHTIIT